MISHVSERGQITIDRAVREQLGVKPGMVAYQRVVGGRLEIVFLPAPHRRSLAGALRQPAEAPKVLTRSDVEEAVMEAMAEEQTGESSDHA